MSGNQTKTKSGFTLIELLVVVLIIGILAAIAMPQYELAVEKARTNAILPILKSIDSAEKIYFLNNGKYTASFNDLEISMPSGGVITKSGITESIVYPKLRCLLRYGAIDSMGSYSAYCYPSTGTSIEKYYDRTTFLCWAAQNSERQQKVCQAIAGKTAYDGTSSSSYYYAF